MATAGEETKKKNREKAVEEEGDLNQKESFDRALRRIIKLWTEGFHHFQDSLGVVLCPKPLLGKVTHLCLSV